MPEPDRRRAVLLWTAALLIMVAAAVWQRLSGPSHPRRGTTEIAGRQLRWRLPRTAVSGEPLRVAVPAPDGVAGTVHYRRFPLDEPFREVAMSRQGDTLAGLLPTQPPAGKLEYYVALVATGGSVRVPESEPVVMRFRGEVPAVILVSHVVAMFLSMLIGVRAALAALVGRPEARRHAGVALAGITLGGLLLGPLVQKYAFGAFWTGWPFGTDLTDNKTLVMWLAWAAAVVVLRLRYGPADRVGRAMVVAACLVMLAVYLVPHSLHGSQLDYRGVGAVEEGDEPLASAQPRRLTR